MPPNEKLNPRPNVYWTTAATCMNITRVQFPTCMADFSLNSERHSYSAQEMSSSD
jgi:hypothetical protein